MLGFLLMLPGFRSAPEGAEQGEISSLFFDTALAGFDTQSISIFSEFESWPGSNTLREDDTAVQVLHTARAYNSNPNRFSWVDINGDGLTDLLYHYYNSSNYRGGGQYAIYLNQGNADFSLLYKCFYNTDLDSYPYTWYGDCAQT